jgi:hypothetical protein
LEKRDNFLMGFVLIAIFVIVGFGLSIRGGTDLLKLLGVVVMTVGVMTGIPLQLMVNRE